MSNLKRYSVTWEESHSATVMAEDEEQAQELAFELDSHVTYGCAEDPSIEKVSDKGEYPLTEIDAMTGELFSEAYAAWIKENR